MKREPSCSGEQHRMRRCSSARSSVARGRDRVANRQRRTAITRARQLFGAPTPAATPLTNEPAADLDHTLCAVCRQGHWQVVAILRPLAPALAPQQEQLASGHFFTGKERGAEWFRCCISGGSSFAPKASGKTVRIRSRMPADTSRLRSVSPWDQSRTSRLCVTRIGFLSATPIARMDFGPGGC